MADYTYFSQATIQLQAELASGYHDTLCQVLALCPDIEEKMSAIATHCGVLVEDDFDQARWDSLCDDMVKILREHKREEKAPLILIPYQ